MSTERAAGKQLRDDLYVTSVDLKKRIKSPHNEKLVFVLFLTGTYT